MASFTSPALEPPPKPRWWTSPWVGPAVAVVLYLHTCWYGFVIDDVPLIEHNPVTRSLRNLASFFVTDGFQRVVHGPSSHFYRPLLWVTLTLEYAAYGVHAWGYHALNVVAHAAVCLLIYYVALALPLERSTAVLASLLFAVHPTHVEVVAWPSAIPEIMTTICVLASLLLYIRYRECAKKSRLALSAAFFLVGLWFKEMAIVVPVLILLYEWGFGRIRRAFRASVLVAYGVALAVYLAGRSVAISGILSPGTAISTRVELLTVPQVVAFYVAHLLMPLRLSADYDLFYVTGFGPLFWQPVVEVLAAALVAVILWRRAERPRALAFCLILIALTLLPVLDLRVFQWRELAHDRYLYVPSVFFCLALAIWMSGLRWPARIRSILAGTLVVVYASLLVANSLPWRSKYELYRRGVEVAPENVRPRYGLALELLKLGRRNDAAQQLRETVRLAPTWFEPRFGLGEIEFSEGHYADAERDLAVALELRPEVDPATYASVRSNTLLLLAESRMRLQHYDAAADDLRSLIALTPSSPGLHYELGRCLAAQGRPADAKTEFQAEIAMGGRYADAARAEMAKLGR